ncbi:hypothetical protein [Sporomusa acidovorans]|uniref:hypothetical protein n=1 Tax=Sporomusa acidovorans TaxID=112900 RepID=UPI00146DAC0B|nr:hypothetical protein [Sporomusa acidovorans]
MPPPKTSPAMATVGQVLPWKYNRIGRAFRTANLIEDNDTIALLDGSTTEHVVVCDHGMPDEWIHDIDPESCNG